MPSLVGVRFRISDNVHYFDSVEFDLEVGERVIVDSEQGPREGFVVIGTRQVLFSELRGPMPAVLERVGNP